MTYPALSYIIPDRLGIPQGGEGLISYSKRREVCLTMMIRIIALTALTITVGCIPVTELAIADLEESKVTVQADPSEGSEAIFAKAAEGCAIHGRIPVYLSTTKRCESTACFASAGSAYCGPSDCHEVHLYACVRQ